MNIIKNIIFDWGGVITNIDFHRTIDAFKKYGIDDYEKYYCKEYQAPLFQDHEVGKITPAEFRVKLRKIIPVEITDDQLDKAWFAMLLDTPKRNLELLAQLKDKYSIFLLSNTNAIHVAMYDEIFNSKYNLKGGFRYLFEKAYYSHEIGMRKPHKEIFEFVINDSGLDPSETVFIDDSIQNINTAKKLGMQTIHFTNKDSLIDVFSEFK